MHRVAIGFDVGGTTIKAGVVASDVGGKIEIVASADVATDALSAPSEFVELVADQCRKFCIAYPEIEAVGVGFPSCVAWEAGTVSKPPNIRWWSQDDYPLRDILCAQIGLPVSLDNDANVAAFAELQVGVGRSLRSFLLVTLGTGVGGALVLDRKLYRGDRGGAGEIGHMIYEPTVPPQNPMWRTGILEAYIGRDAIVARARQILGRDPSSALSQLGDALDVAEIGAAARAGDRVAVETIIETAHIFGIGLASALALIGIEHVVVTGGIAGLPPLFYEETLATLRQRAIPTIAERVMLYRSPLGQTAGIIGAALLALSHAAASV
ncbi:MAG: ROK family protein [Chlorobi bacterium]|nr:ROK family protein [Chlorobiota bacterium]